MLDGQVNKERKIIVTDSRDNIADLNLLPFPDRSHVDYDKYMKFLNEAAVTNSITLQGTRGCPFNCAYCHKIWPKKHLFRSAENIIEEIEIYHKMGVQRFTLIDDIFNYNKKNATRFFQLVLKKKLDIQIFFPNGTRGDLLTEQMIDIMVEAGTVQLPMALETASPRLQKMIGKNLDLEKLHRNMSYLCKTYPNIISGLFLMIGFPSETEEEAWKTLDFVKSIQWIHFPELHVLTIYPGTRMVDIAMGHGISIHDIHKNLCLGFHHDSSILPFKDKSFITRFRTAFLKDYFLKKERFLSVFPGQMEIMTEKEIIWLYSSILQLDLKNFDQLFDLFGITENELNMRTKISEDTIDTHGLNEKISLHFQHQNNAPEPGATRVLLLDLTHHYSSNEADVFTQFIEPPLGLMYLSTYLKLEMGNSVFVKIAKSFVDFDSDEELIDLVNNFNPDVIGLRVLTVYKDFLHGRIKVIREAHYQGPVIVGGPHSTTCYQEVLKDHNVDVAVIGEGEVTFTELVKRIRANANRLDGTMLRSINGIAYKA